MTVERGQTLSHYRLVEKIGEGGMGVVWKAEDTKLKRPVALKFLNEKYLARHEQKARFLREARLAAALNHPSICTIHEVAEIPPGMEHILPSGERLPSGTPFIEMELIEGNTLKESLRRSRSLPLDELLRIGVHIAEGLTVAHAKGIVHRDLKPGNVMINADGRAKILDFGLAKPLEPVDPADPVLSKAATISEELSREGMVVGTSAYMSPEQAKGERLDTRSDIFSFGIMLYEMVAGVRPFRGDTATTTRLKIIESEPEPLPDTRTDLPPDLERIIRRCLKKKPEERYNDTRDLVASLKDLREETSSGKQRVISGIQSLEKGKTRIIGWVPLAVGLTLTVVIAAAAIWYLARQKSPPPPPVHKQITFTGSAFLAEISPDGQFLAYWQHIERNRRLIVQDLASGQEWTISQSEGKITYPLRWSPEGTELLFLKQEKTGPGSHGWRLALVSRFGGTPHWFSNVYSYLAWSPDGTGFAGASITSKVITRVDIGTEKTLTIPLNESITWFRGIDWSPPGNFLLFWATDEHGGIGIWSIPSDGGEALKVYHSDFPISVARWSPEGDGIFFLVDKGKGEWDFSKIRVDPGTGVVIGDPSIILGGWDSSYFSFSSDGKKLAYTKGAGHSNLSLVSLEKGGTVDAMQLTTGTYLHRDPRFSPDGRQVAFVREGNIFTMPVEGGSPTQLTFFDSSIASPAWSPDGKMIAFGSMEGGIPRVWQIPARGGRPRPFEESNLSESLGIIWAPGEKILYHRQGNRNLHLLDPATEEEKPLVEDDSVGWIFSPAYSPDGKQVAVNWNNKRDGIGLWVISLEDSSQTQISEGWGKGPFGWSTDGSWVYTTNGQKIPAAGGEAESFIDFPSEVDWCRDMTPDGKHFLCIEWETQSDTWLVENFDPDLN